ncbi:MAG TPA: DNA translocase FtsK [Solirubrobacteraceae bacterium]|jgi:S-DNA-T family DNA segregation ATPase FtsK/SpoIIIE|nr:DNA translocase FtsK [Solirubrobacteraceae bacterium]
MPATRKSPKRQPARKQAARRGARANTRTRSRSGRGRGRGSAGLLDGFSLRWPVLSQNQRDVLGLGLVAVGVFMGFVLYGHWDGGKLGQGLASVLGWCFGEARALAPAALLIGGSALLFAQFMPTRRPLRTGGLCLFAAATLALAAGTLGVSSGTPADAGSEQWRSVFLQSHGGILGQGIFWVADRLVQTVGVDILVVFLLVVGVVLLTGLSLAVVVRATGNGLVDTSRVLRARASALERSGKSAGDEHAKRAQTDSRESAEHPLQPPEPAPEELIVRATHVEAPSVDGAAPVLEPWDVDVEDVMEPGEPDGGHDPQAKGEDEDGSFSAVDLRSTQESESDEEDEVPAEPIDESLLTPQGRLRDAVTDDPEFVWELPGAERILTRSTAEQAKPDTAGQERTATSLVEALGHFGVQAKVIGTVAGPHITRYELRLAPGTKVGKVAQLKDDLAYALAATDIRILAPIPGKQAVGVEVPNAKRRMVRLGDVFQEPPKDWSPLTVWLGKDVAGKAIGADLAKMPHLLVAGTTGAGKSGAINAMLCSVLLRATPHELRLVLVDPKQVELNHYESIPHLLTPVITSPRMAANALQNLVREMEQRYGIMSLSRTRSLIELNKAREARNEAPLPYILCVIDELADLMMVAPADVEDSIIRLAQKARAVGIHLVLATQSPRVDVITGMIKANVPSRIAFSVSSQTDSRVILDQNGAESLLGQGDMLFSPVGSSRLQRIQGAYIDESQIAKLTDMWRKQGEPDLREELLEQVEPAEPEKSSDDEFDPDEDPLLSDAIRLVAEMQTASTSMLQRRLRLGYTRAGRLIDMLERRGVISGYEGSKPRQVLIGEADVPRVLAMVDGSGATKTPSEASVST